MLKSTALSFSRRRASLAVLSAIMSFLSWSSHGQTPEEVEILEKLLPTHCYHSGYFIQSHFKKRVSKPMVSYGRFLFSCRHGLIWQIKRPIDETLIYPLAEAPTRLYQDTLKTLDDKVQTQIGELLNQLIGGNTDFISKNFSVSASAEAAILTPKRFRMKKALSNIEIHRSGAEVSIELHKKNGDRSQLSISEPNVMQTIDLDQCISNQLVPERACQILLSDKPLK